MFYSIIINYADKGMLDRLRVVRNIDANKKEQLLSVLLNEIDMDGSDDKLHIIDNFEKNQKDHDSWADFVDIYSIVN